MIFLKGKKKKKQFVDIKKKRRFFPPPRPKKQKKIMQNQLLEDSGNVDVQLFPRRLQQYLIKTENCPRFLISNLLTVAFHFHLISWFSCPHHLRPSVLQGGTRNESQNSRAQEERRPSPPGKGGAMIISELALVGIA
jgi:hypothetical protein